MIKVSSILLFLGFTVHLLFDPEQNKHVIEHEVRIDHPGFTQYDNREFVLMEQLEGDGKTAHFFMDVESTICLEGVCKIVPVRLYWTPLGNYMKYELKNGITLEKTEGAPFLEEDYALLHEVLSDVESPYKDILYHQITKDKVQDGDEEVDGLSGATVTILEKGKTVVGAAWTCFTLWHWTHGPIVGNIRRIYGKKQSVADLRNMLDSDDQKKVRFALDELSNRNEGHVELSKELIRLLQSEDSELVDLVIASIANSEGRLDFIVKALGEVDKNARIKLLTFIKYHSFQNTGLHLTIVDVAINAQNLQEVDLCLDILGKHELDNESIISKLMILLDEEIVISRRAYYFLSELELQPTAKQRLIDFATQNREYLY